MSKRKNHNPNFKAKVALEAIKGDLTIPETAQKYEVHPTQITRWKKEALDNLVGIFDKTITIQKNQDDKEKEELYKQIGKMKVQLDFLQTRPGL